MKNLLSKVKMPGSKKKKNSADASSNSETNSKDDSKDGASTSSKEDDAPKAGASASSADVELEKKMLNLPKPESESESTKQTNAASDSVTSSEENPKSTKNEQISTEITKSSVESSDRASTDPSVESPKQEDAVTTDNSSTSSTDKNENESSASNEESSPKVSPLPSIDDEGVHEILKQLDIDSPTVSTEEKIKVLCTIFKASVAENVQYKEASKNIIDQLDKNEQTKEALQKLCKALKTQVELKREEGELKLREETQKRIDCTTSFQNVITDLSVLVEKHNGHNKSLQQENQALAVKLRELLQTYEKREDKIEQLRTEFGLQLQLFEAQIAKAKLEKTEVTANFNSERIGLQKQILEGDQQMMLMLNREELLKEQVELYQKQYSEVEKNIGGTTANFQHFRKEIERVTKELKKVERDTDEWKAKFEESQTLVKKMNYQNLDREKEMEGMKRKLVAMEKLNRHLSQERTNLLKKVEETETKQPNGDST